SFCCFRDCTATAGIYPLSLHDALPISDGSEGTPRVFTATWTSLMPPSSDSVDSMTSVPQPRRSAKRRYMRSRSPAKSADSAPPRSEEHTSELQSRENLVCRLLLEKKKK